MATRWRSPKDPKAGGDDPSRSPDTEARSLLAADETGKTRRLLVDGLNNLFVKFRSISNLIWRTDVDWNKGTVPSTMEVSGSDDAAILRLKDKTDNDDNIDYEIPAEYVLSDGAKLEIIGGQAKLKAISGSENNWPFTAPASYTYDSAKIKIVGGKAKLIGGTGIYAQYHLNESSGTNVDDASPNNRDGTTINMEDSDWVAGKLNNCLQFDGTNEYVNCGDIGNFERTDPFSLECWIKTTDAGNACLLTKALWDGSTYRGYILTLSAGKLRVYLVHDTGANEWIDIITNVTVNDNTYKHVVVTYDGSSLASGLTIYVNNVSQVVVVNRDLLGSNTILTTANFQISGRGGANELFEGQIDEVVVYDKELSVAEVAARYNSGSGTEDEGFDTNNPSIVPNSGYAFTAALNTFTETIVTPSGTGIKYHCSSDNGVTWKYWTGAAWVVTDDSYTQANTAANVDTNIGSLASSGIFKFRALLNSDGSNTPELDNIYTSELITYSTIDDLYIDTKDASQIPPAAILTWISTLISNTKPVNTDIRILFSNNGRASWLTWSGSWQAPTSAITRTDATPITDAQNNFSSLPLGSNTLDVRLFLYTSDSSVRPQISNINATSDTGYEISGTYETNIVDSGSLSLDWGEIGFSRITPSGTSMTVKIRASNNLTVMGAYGPDLDDGGDAGVIGQFVQFEVVMSGTLIARPSLDSVSVQYVTPSVQDVAP